MKKKKHNKMPAMLWFTGDWLKDPAVRCLSLDARGLWIDMICLMYESPIRGHLSLANGDAVTDVQLSRMVGASLDDVKRLLREMTACGVFSVSESGVIISRRMVFDEQVRATKSAAGKKGMAVRYNRSPIKPTTPLEDETETELDIQHSSPNNYLLQRRARENGNELLEIVMAGIPVDRMSNPVRTKAEILLALDTAAEKGVDLEVAAEMLAVRFAAYYNSAEGRGEYFKAPHNWLAQECHLVDPAVWKSREPKAEETGWSSIKKGNKHE